MPEEITIKSEETPPSPTVAESQLQMAVTFGQMTEANRQLMEKLNRTESEQMETKTILKEALTEIQALRNQNTIGIQKQEKFEKLQEDIITTVVKENLSKEDKEETLVVTPIKEKKKEETKSKKKRGMFLTMMFGKDQTK